MLPSKRDARDAHFLVEVIASKLNGGIRHYADAVCAISPHEPSPAFVPPHLRQTFANGKLIFLPSSTLYLEKDLQSLKRGDHCPRNCTGDTPGAKGCKDRLRDHLTHLEDFNPIFRLEGVIPSLYHTAELVDSQAELEEGEPTADISGSDS